MKLQNEMAMKIKVIGIIIQLNVIFSLIFVKLASRPKMSRDISSAARINPRSTITTMSMQASLLSNELYSPDQKQTSQGFFRKSQLVDIMNEKPQKESFNNSNQKLLENSNSMKVSFQGPEYSSADSRNIFKSFGNINTRSRIRLSKLG